MKHEQKIWEPVADLMVQALDNRCEPMKPEDALEPDERQDYASTAIGHDLDDPEGCRSYIDVITGDGREADEELARQIVDGLQLLHDWKENMQKVAERITKARDFSRMVSLGGHPMPGEYVVTAMQAGNIHGEKGHHLMVGYVVQVRKKAGAFGSDLVLIRHPDGTLMQHHNQCFIRLCPEQEAELKAIFRPGMTPDEYEDYSKPYTLGAGQYPATGKIIEPGEAEAPPQDNSPMMQITVAHADGKKELHVV